VEIDELLPVGLSELQEWWSLRQVQVLSQLKPLRLTAFGHGKGGPEAALSLLSRRIEIETVISL
jgi:hypothetical protein